MQFTDAVCHVVLLAMAVSASRNVMQHHPAIKKADVVHKALLEGGKSTATLGCKVGDPDCGEQLKTVMQVGAVIKEAEDIEDKADEAAIDAKKLMEEASEVKAAKKEEESQAAAEVATEEKLDTVKEEVKNEAVEMREEQKTLETEQQNLKQTVDTNPTAAAIVAKDEDAIKADLKAKEVGVKVKKQEEKTIAQQAIVAKMKRDTAEATTVAKINLFKAEDNAVKLEQTQITPKEIYKVELKTYKLQTAIVKTAAKEPPKKPTVAELVRQVEETRVKEAVEKIAMTKIEAKKSVDEKKKAETQIEEVMDEAKVNKEVQKITKEFGSVEELEEKLEKCQPCPVKVAAAPAALAPAR
eukprot:gnl/MRDRNA2_/MRDRNA2_94552_c0_seq1.p1 gnl/MRDRNA2_/MRDRNA2_94552_c0~~gnl/MRDRNA2_/MRDRNA2_94552_c0_seq1.p1  ORF type:complete len:355 (-),score=142.58 gnl/MRDRNA2_/MRDRNA2_94552_c0_seq1:97-1161(-)